MPPLSSLLHKLQSLLLGSWSTHCSSSYYSHTVSTPKAKAPNGQFEFERFEIDSITGFVPCYPPVTFLPSQFARWEQALSLASKQLALADDDSPQAIAKRASGSQWRESIRQWPIIDTALLIPEHLRRAHHVLAFLVHFYVHSSPPGNGPMIVPASLAVPLVKVSQKLGIAPILTFADTVLWNHQIIEERLPLTRANIRPLTLFTGSSDEANFYGCCAEIELRGVEALRAIALCYDIHSEDLDGLDRLADCLQTVSRVIDDLTTILESVRPICDPHAFYFAVRPWFRGSDAGGPAAQRWIYEGVDESDHLELSGPSAGQSSIIHTLDIFLEVDHHTDSNWPETAAGPRTSCPHSSSSSRGPLNGEFMTRMRLYMPGSHQSFLEELTLRTRELAGKWSIRSLASQHPEKLLAPYNAAVLALKKFRDTHIRIACLYVVSMSRKNGQTCPSGGNVGMPSMCPAMKSRPLEPTRGTGGNELSLLLKSCRDATSRTILTP